nr:DNA-binding protein [Escherichia coli]
METVLHALKAMGKANSVELAARLDISREEVLNELWELKKMALLMRIRWRSKKSMVPRLI